MAKILLDGIDQLKIGMDSTKDCVDGATLDLLECKKSFAIQRPGLTFAATNNRIQIGCPQRKSFGDLLKKLKMPLTKERKATNFGDFGGKETNTGSIQAQIAILTERISQISNHLQGNKKDFSTHRGLMQLVGKRKRLLNYLQKHDLNGYRQLIEKLGIRK